jgi:hypothetical protein
MASHLISAVTGRAYFPKGSYTTFTPVALTLYAVPFVAPMNGLTPSSVGVNVTGAGAGANCDVRIGIYKDAGGRPGDLLCDFGAITALTGTGSNAVTPGYGGALVPRPLLWGGQVYWLASIYNTAATTMPTVAAVDTGVIAQDIAAGLGVAGIASLPSSAATAASSVALAAQTYGALPATAPAMTAVVNAKAPYFGMIA